METQENPEDQNREMADRYRHIKGWGIDIDPRNEPTYPIKNYTGADHNRLHYPRPMQQVATVEVLKSNERPSLPAVYGTSVPPRGLSGRLRRYAFRFSESSYGHWLPLLFADRVDAVEGVVEDLKKGTIPNILVEKGLRAEWKYNRPAFARKLLVIGLAVGAIVVIGKVREQIIESD